MKIFAFNLCLSFESQLPGVHEKVALLDWRAATAIMQHPDRVADTELRVAVPDDPRAAEQVFALQADERWRESSLTWRWIFPAQATLAAFLAQFSAHFHPVEAAGGLVLNEREQALMILNRSKWSLPKGHVEQAESPEFAAWREVIEETGLKEATVKQALAPTWHTFAHRDKKWILKKTHWFLMYAHSQQALSPQQDENIESVRWISRKQWQGEAFPTYPLTRFFLADHWL